MIKILFDWNGTLLNDVEASYLCMTSLQREYGIPPLENIEAYRRIFGFPIRSYYEKAGFDFSKISWEKTGEEFMKDWLARYPRIGLNEQALAVLKRAQNDGFACFILSATRLDLLKSQIALHPELKDLIDGVYGIGDIYASSKEKAAREFRASCLEWDEVFMIGDTLHDLEVARSIGAHCILYDGGHQCRFTLDKSKAPVAATLEEALERIEQYAGSHH